MTIGERIKKIRIDNKLSQSEFAERIGIGQAALSALEKGIRNVVERNILLICEKFSINEVWLRTGEGDMFVRTDQSIIRELADKYNMTENEYKIIQAFANMDEYKRKTVADAFFNFIDALNQNNEVAATVAVRPAKQDSYLSRAEKEAMMKEQLDKEEDAAVSSASTFINGLDGSEKMA